MKFATKKDIEAPLATVWAALTDFEAWERAAMRRGVDVSRVDTLPVAAAGSTWKARFVYRSKERKVEVKLIEMAAPGLLVFDATSGAVNVSARIEVMEMSARRSRMHVTMEVRPLSLGARLFLQSLRLARAKVDRKFEARVGQFVTDLEQRLRHAPRRA